MTPVSSPKFVTGNRERKTEIRIIARHGGLEATVFYVTILRDLSIVVGTADPNFRVRRIDHEGNPLEGPENVVDRPHATFHPPALFHLRADGIPRVLAGLVWTAPEPGSPHFASPWLEFTTSSLQEVDFVSPPSARSRRKIPFFFDVPSRSCSVVLVADFIKKNSQAVDPDYPRAKYLIAGDVTMRLRIGGMEPQAEATAVFTIMG
ncbi:hypothetical protein [Methylobacterium sp. 1973]|uniref:hypothetical protein n=1 Tax=Methylobacterium sp. 1973 TaxID=3156421 RepID=UPI0033976D8C